jgi:hypothetical protein
LKTEKEQIEEYFKGLHFVEETHTYTVGEQQLPSVSGLIKKFCPKFDAINISKAIAKRDGRDAAEIRAEWKEIADHACAIGTEAHLFGEHYPLDKTLEPKTGFEEAIKKFWDTSNVS